MSGSPDPAQEREQASRHRLTQALASLAAHLKGMTTLGVVSARESARERDGRFGVQPRAEFDALDLTAEVNPHEPDPGDVLARNIGTLDLDDPEHVAALNDFLRRIAPGTLRAKGKSQRLDAGAYEDAVQETLLYLVSRRGSLDSTKSARTYAKSVLSGVVVRLGADDTRSENITARGRYRDLEAAFVAENGRPLTPQESADLADRIRLEAPPKRRPSKDFMVGETRAFPTGDLSSLDGPALPKSSTAAAVVDGSFMAKIMDTIDDDLRGDMPGTRRYHQQITYNAIAEMRGAPLIQHRTIARRRGTAARRVISDEKALRAVIERWQDGRITEGESEALFTPWGGLDDPREQAAVVDVLTRAGGGHYAWDLWDHGLKGAKQESG